MSKHLEFFDWMKKNYNRSPEAKEQMDCWLAGTQDKIPKIWWSYLDRYQKETAQTKADEEREYAEYLRLRAKFGNK